MTEGELRLASSIKFIFTKNNVPRKTVEVTASNDGSVPGTAGKRTPGRKQIDPALKKKGSETLEEIKRLKAEWGKAYKPMIEKKDPIHPKFLILSQSQECAADAFYQKIFREMAYGVFPKGVFYDKNRDSLVCSENIGKRNSLVRKQRLAKYVRVCLPGRPQGINGSEFPTDTLETQTNTTCEFGLEQGVGDRLYWERRALKYISKCHQRNDLPVGELATKYGLSAGRLFEEIKLFMYMCIDVISPRDELLMQDDTQQVVQQVNYVNTLKAPQSWKRLSVIERASMISRFCSLTYLRCVDRRLDALTPHQSSIMDSIERFVTGLYLTGLLKDDNIIYEDGKMMEIRGVTISEFGIKVNKEVMEAPAKDDEMYKVCPVVIQRYKTVDLQKINNGVQKQEARAAKVVLDMTETSDSEI